MTDGVRVKVRSENWKTNAEVGESKERHEKTRQTKTKQHKTQKEDIDKTKRPRPRRIQRPRQDRT